MSERADRFSFGLFADRTGARLRAGVGAGCRLGGGPTSEGARSMRLVFAIHRVQRFGTFGRIRTAGSVRGGRSVLIGRPS